MEDQTQQEEKENRVIAVLRLLGLPTGLSDQKCLVSNR